MSAAAPLPPEWHPLHYLPRSSGSLVDIGCNTGAALAYAHELGVEKLYGVDINPRAIQEARVRLGSSRQTLLAHGSADEIPFPDGCAQVALCSEVLEHIPSERRSRAVQEIHRVLGPGGTLILTVPTTGVFASLDPANARLRFPRAFGVVSRFLGGPGRDAGFEGQKHGIVRHHHFSLPELRQLLDGYFEIRTVRWRGGALSPLVAWAQFPFYRTGAHENAVMELLRRIGDWDAGRNLGPQLAYNVLVVAERR